MELTLYSEHPTDTRAIGRILAGCLKPGAVVALVGELGSGKTELVKGLAQGLGLDADDVTSPTYTLINEYDGALPLYHFDLYRLDRAEQLDEIGAFEYFWGEGVCAVEWADLFPGSLPAGRLSVRFIRREKDLREIKLSAAWTDTADEEKCREGLQKYEKGNMFK